MRILLSLLLLMLYQTLHLTFVFLCLDELEKKTQFDLEIEEERTRYTKLVEELKNLRLQHAFIKKENLRLQKQVK